MLIRHTNMGKNVQATDIVLLLFKVFLATIIIPKCGCKVTIELILILKTLNNTIMPTVGTFN